MTQLIPDASDLSLDRIKEATQTINPVFLRSPQFVDERLSAELGREVLVKLETDNPLHSFKGRGADFFARQLDPALVPVCQTAGNFGQAMAYSCRARGIPVEIFVNESINPSKLDRMRSLGVTVTPISGDAEAAAREHVERHEDRVFIADGKEPAIAEGAGTIGVELLAPPAGGRGTNTPPAGARGTNTAPAFDTVVVPIGDGALINGIARWIKAHAPEVRVVGVCSTGAPAMERSWRTGTLESYATDTIAAGISVRTPIPDSLRRLRALVDDIVLVDDDALVEAMRLAAETLGTLLEPAGASGLAAITRHDLPGDRLAVVLTGGNPNPDLLAGLFTRP